MPISLEVHPLTGSDISDCLDSCHRIVNTLGLGYVWFEFNDSKFTVYPAHCIEWLSGPGHYDWYKRSDGAGWRRGKFHSPTGKKRDGDGEDSHIPKLP